MYSDILEKIVEYKRISIFRHARPDGDCMFSALALYEFLKDNFKDKTVKIAGEDRFDLISRNDRISDRFIKNSLAIVLDTSTTERVDDPRFTDASYIIKIDHHPQTESYADLDKTRPAASSTCELLAKILLSKDFKEYRLSDKACTYLYCGMLTDTLNFKTANVTSDTLRIASKIVKRGNLMVSDLSEWVFNEDLLSYQKTSKIRNYLEVNDKYGYIILNKKDLEEIDIEPIDAKNRIEEIGNISDLNIWSFFVEIDGLYDGSLRSKRPYVINEIASRYNGGGHKNACGVKRLSVEMVEALNDELYKLSISNENALK